MGFISERKIREKDKERLIQYEGYNNISNKDVPYKKISLNQYIAAPAKYKSHKVSFREIICNIWLELIIILTNIILAVMIEPSLDFKYTWYFYFVIIASLVYIMVTIIKLNQKVITTDSELVEVVLSDKMGNRYMNQYFTVLFPESRNCIIRKRIFDKYEYDNTPLNTEMYMVKNSNMTFFIPKYDS